MRVAIGVAAVALVLAGCDWMERSDPSPRVDPAKERLEQVKRACSSKLTYARLKEYVFDEAARIGVSDPRYLDPLSAHSVVRMVNPLVKSRDEELNITVCTGRFVLNLPPGIQDAFNRKPVIEANVEYAAQAALDGSGLVYSMNGAEPIIYRIATLGLRGRPVPQLVATSATNDKTEVAVAEASQQPAAASPARVPGPDRKPANVAAKAESPLPRPVQNAAGNTRPSFNCRHAKTRSEKLVCGSGSLAAADRQMSAAYYGEMARADGEIKRALRRTREQFLAKRDRCSSESCVADAYKERVAEIRRLSDR